MISKTIGYNGVHNIFRHTHIFLSIQVSMYRSIYLSNSNLISSHPSTYLCLHNIMNLDDSQGHMYHQPILQSLGFGVSKHLHDDTDDTDDTSSWKCSYYFLISWTNLTNTVISPATFRSAEPALLVRSRFNLLPRNGNFGSGGISHSIVACWTWPSRGTTDSGAVSGGKLLHF